MNISMVQKSHIIIITLIPIVWTICQYAGHDEGGSNLGSKQNIAQQLVYVTRLHIGGGGTKQIQTSAIPENVWKTPKLKTKPLGRFVQSFRPQLSESTAEGQTRFVKKFQTRLYARHILCTAEPRPLEVLRDQNRHIETSEVI